VYDLTPEVGYFTEPSIAVNSRDPRQVVAAFQDNAHISFSRDGGRHWQAAAGIAPPNYFPAQNSAAKSFIRVRLRHAYAPERTELANHRG
jgi:hypothetical protein